MNTISKVFQCKVIAEVGSVHDGSFGNALRLVDVAKAAGADIVKFQTHLADAETLPDAPMPPYFKGEPRYEYFKRTGFSPDQWQRIAEHCRDCGIGFLSSVFSIDAVDLLEEVGVESYKIPSGEVTNSPLLERVAATGKSVLLSSGMSNWAELKTAIRDLDGAAEIIPMQCATAYPCPPSRIGLNVMAEMRERFGLPIGFSDHTTGLAAGPAAAALGAICVEKHLTFSTKMYGSDAPNAMEPETFTMYVAGLREVWSALQNPVDKDDLAAYGEMKKVFEKSIVAARDLPAGTVIERAHLAYKKPGDGLSAARYRDVLGRVTAVDLPRNHKLMPEDLK